MTLCFESSLQPGPRSMAYK